MDLKQIKNRGSGHRKKMRVGRGPGSGKGKTSGRGQKGYGSRSGTGGKLGFEGGQMPIYRRLPKRGFTNSPFQVNYSIINVGDLKGFESGETVDLEGMKARGLVKKNARLLKVLGGGEIEIGLKIRAHRFSAAARRKIEEAGGEVLEN